MPDNQNETDYYKILGVSRGATDDEIRKAYKRLAKQTHPDKTHNNNHAKFIKVDEAFKLLSDPDKRKAYDGLLGQSTCQPISQQGAFPDDTFFAKYRMAYWMKLDHVHIYFAVRWDVKDLLVNALHTIPLQDCGTKGFGTYFCYAMNAIFKMQFIEIIDGIIGQASIRVKLADKIVESLLIDDEAIKPWLKKDIIQNLWGSTYTSLFCNKEGISEDDLENNHLIEMLRWDAIRQMNGLHFPICKYQFLTELKWFLDNEIERLESKPSDKRQSLQNLSKAIETLKHDLISKSIQERNKIVANLVRHLDIICHHSDSKLWSTPTSEKTWLNFKKTHKEVLYDIDKTIKINSSLRMARVMNYKQYQKRMGFFDGKSNGVVDLQTDIRFNPKSARKNKR